MNRDDLFVSASHERGFWRGTVHYLGPITSIEDIKEIENKIQESSPDLKGILIINWRRFEDPE
jgi:hypothetical protein